MVCDVRLPTALCTLALLAAALACSSAGSDDHVSVRDSVGITIVESREPAWSGDDAWRFEEPAALLIGVLAGDPALEFFDARAAARRADGTIVVMDNGSKEIRVFGPDGVLRFRGGGEGAGPGEFRRVNWLTLLEGDSIGVYDITRRRLSIFGPEADYARPVDFARGGRLFFPQLVGRTVDGGIIGVLRINRPMDQLPSGEVWDSLAVVLFEPGGTLRDTVVWVPNWIRDVRMRTIGENRRRIPANLPYSPRAVAAVSGDALFVGRTNAFEIRVHDLAGRLTRVVRKENAPTEIGSADVDRLVDYWRDFYQGRLDNPEVRYFLRTLRDTPVPRYFPHFDSLAVDAAGNLWVSEYRRPGEETWRWNVFDTEGRWLGRVRGPEGFRATEFGADYVLGFLRDEMDVQRLALFRLVKP